MGPLGYPRAQGESRAILLWQASTADHPRWIIPVDTGKTIPARRRLDHPRAHGGNRFMLWLLAVLGSFPCKRGECLGMGGQGLDHPRTHGENASIAQTLNGAGGSSPRTRGKRHRGLSRFSRRTDHPRVHGANRPPMSASAYSRGSSPLGHPRTHGGNMSFPSQRSEKHGSSPCTRGKRARLRPLPQLRRIIPAYTGETIR